MHKKISALCGAVAFAFLAACAPASVASHPSTNSDIITFDQLASVRTATAFEAIQKVRPSFLYSRGSTTVLGTSAAYPTVYVDGVRYGSLETLRQIPASWIDEVKLYRVSSPGNFTFQEMGGVIAIKTRLK